MKFDSQKHHRRSIRLPDHLYMDGAYFVTICTHQRECIFGTVAGDAVNLSACGEIARDECLQTPILRPDVKLDAFAIMPNHIHMILFLVGVWRRQTPTPAIQRAYAKPIVGSLGTIIGAYKSAATRKINRLRQTPGAPVWQRNYHEHVIRDQKSLDALREYVLYNPALWSEDQENPARKS